jgi:hypothetical protein
LSRSRNATQSFLVLTLFVMKICSTNKFSWQWRD